MTADATPATRWGWFEPASPEVEFLPPDWRRARLLEDLHYHRPRSGPVHTARVGLVTDGASIPWILAPLAGQRMSGKHLLPAFIHDQLCQQASTLGGRGGLRLRQYADRIFGDMLRAAGGSAWSAWSKGVAVRLGTLGCRLRGDFD